MYKKCGKYEYDKTQEKDMLEIVTLLEKHNYICVFGTSKNGTKHILIVRKFKDLKFENVNIKRGKR
jgi:hypothetical protein